MDKKSKEEKDAQTGVEKRVYKTPTLFIYGSVKELTNGGASGPIEQPPQMLKRRS